MEMNLSKLAPKDKSIILSCLAGGGVALTGYLSAKCAAKAEKRETKKEKALAYAPAIASGCATIACIGVSTYISGEEIAALTLACAATAQKLADYRAAVHETVDPEEETRINEAFYLKEIERLEQELSELEHPRDDDDLCEFVDAYSGYTFRARLEGVMDGIRQAKQAYEDNESLAWCDIFYLLNDGDTKPYDSALGGGSLSSGWFDYGIGWSKGMMEEFYSNDDHFDFDIFVEALREKPGVYVINYSVLPEPSYMEY